jgi:DNA-binding response OmpR family regulator
MPVMNGHELRARLLADVATADIPVVAMTAATREEGRGLQATAYFEKPFSLDALLRLLARVVEEPPRQAEARLNGGGELRPACDPRRGAHPPRAAGNG